MVDVSINPTEIRNKELFQLKVDKLKEFYEKVTRSTSTWSEKWRRNFSNGMSKFWAEKKKDCFARFTAATKPEKNLYFFHLWNRLICSFVTEGFTTLIEVWVKYYVTACFTIYTYTDDSSTC